MARGSKRDRDRRDGELPWALLLQAGLLVTRRWRSLSEKDRRRLAALARESGGRLGSLSGKQRRELGRLAGKLDLKGLAGELIALGGRRRRR